METITVSEFKATCLRVIDKVNKTGHHIMITKRGVPMALVTPPPPPEKPATWLGLARGSIRIMGDIISPVVPEDDWEALK